jgi:hypothetical protein
MKNMPSKLRSDPLWRDVYDIVELAYGKAAEIADSFPDEKWNTVSKLRNSANDTLFCISQAIGGAEGGTSVYDWSSVRKNLFSLQAMYIFAGKQKFLDIDPEMVVKVDTIIEKVDANILLSKQAAEENKRQELEPWLEKYRLWQKMEGQ